MSIVSYELEVDCFPARWLVVALRNALSFEADAEVSRVYTSVQFCFCVF